MLSEGNAQELNVREIWPSVLQESRPWTKCIHFLLQWNHILVFVKKFVIEFLAKTKILIFSYKEKFIRIPYKQKYEYVLIGYDSYPQVQFWTYF